jgi:cytosine/creatinine deaminase
MIKPLFTDQTPVTDEVLNVIAHVPTKSLSSVAANAFFKKLTDADFMRIGVLLAQKGYDEGGCPIGGVVISNETRQILGKGHNTLVQENHPYNHGETSAIRDAGRQDFSQTTIFTTLSPCDVCATLIYMRQFNRIVIGDVTNASGNEQMIRDKVCRFRFSKISRPSLFMRNIGARSPIRTRRTGRVWPKCARPASSFKSNRDITTGFAYLGNEQAPNVWQRQPEI